MEEIERVRRFGDGGWNRRGDGFQQLWPVDYLTPRVFSADTVYNTNIGAIKNQTTN
jgi:hypothetical protein